MFHASPAATALLVALVLAAIYYVAVYRPAHKAKETYHAPWGMTTPAHHRAKHLNQTGECLTPEQSLQHGCEMRCAEFTEGLTHQDCMYKCFEEADCPTCM